MIQIVLLDTSTDAMTVGWAQPGKPRDLEIRVNEQEVPTKVSLTAGTVRKKNLKQGDQVSFRYHDAESGWTSWHTFEHDGGAPHPPAPRVSLERADDGTGAFARIEFEPIPKCSRYEVSMCTVGGGGDDWKSISDSLTVTLVRKRNLRPELWYSFKYRGRTSESDWGSWSAVSAPVACPAPNPIMARAIAPKLMRVDGSLVDPGSLTDKVVALYFSASWCPPCRQYTPKLVEFYHQMRALGKPFEVIFVSADQEESSFREYFAKMGWLAVPFDDPRREAIQAEHNVRGIPALKVLSSRTGQVIEADAIRYPLTPATLDAWAAKL